MAYGSILGQSFETSPVLDNYFTKDETLTSSTAALYGLRSDAVPDDVLSKLGSASSFGVYGSKSLSHNNKTVEVNLGFKPSIVIIRGWYTFEENFGPTGYEEYFVDNPERISRSIPIILIRGLSSHYTNYNITDTGFSYSDQSIPFDTANGSELYYFAIP